MTGSDYEDNCCSQGEQEQPTTWVVVMFRQKGHFFRSYLLITRTLAPLCDLIIYLCEVGDVTECGVFIDSPFFKKAAGGSHSSTAFF